MDSKKSKLYNELCHECKYKPVAYGFDELVHVHKASCHHPAVEKTEFSTKHFSYFTKDDIKKADHLVEEILKLKINHLSIVCHALLGFPNFYDPIWIEGCEGFVKNT